MEQKSKFSSPTGFSGKLLVASLFILSGILLFARNMGWITAELFSIIVSWYSLFIIMGIYSMVNVTQISRVELFGKETYQLLLKNGVKLRVSLSGYRLLKERLGL